MGGTGFLFGIQRPGHPGTTGNLPSRDSVITQFEMCISTSGNKMLYLPSLIRRVFVAASVLLVQPVAPAQAQGESTGPAVTVQVQLQPPPGVPAGGIPITVIPVGTVEDASVRSVSNDSGLASFRVPLAWFPPTANPQALGVHIMWRDFGMRGGRQVAETIVARTKIGEITGPFRADTPVSASIALAPSATATGELVDPKHIWTWCDDSTINSSWIRRPRLKNDGKWVLDGLPRVSQFTLMFNSASSERIVTLDLSSGTADWGTLVLPQPQGSSRLRLKILGLPASERASTAMVLSLSTGVGYIVSTLQHDGILLGRPEDAAGIALPPGQYAVLVGALPKDERIQFYKKYLRDQLPIDPTKVPIITLVDGQTTETDLNWAEWRPRLLEYSPELRDRAIEAALNAFSAGVVPQNQSSRPGLYLPPGLRSEVLVEPPPQAPNPTPPSPSNPPPGNPTPAQNSNP
jgi:hypothetical protein